MGMAEISLKWALANPGLTCALCGARNARQLEMNARAASGSLTAEVVAELNRVTQPLFDKLGPGFDYFEAPENDRTR
jgi:aryl-alcohol dehydrogenase-like predicted oxidoreductase